MNEDLDRVMRDLTVDVQTAGRLLGIGRNAAYAAAETGQIPALRVGGQYRVPSAKLRDMLGLRAEVRA